MYLKGNNYYIIVIIIIIMLIKNPFKKPEEDFFLVYITLEKIKIGKCFNCCINYVYLFQPYFFQTFLCCSYTELIYFIFK